MGSVSLIPLRGSENEMRRSVAAFTTDPLSVSASGPCGPCEPCGPCGPCGAGGGEWWGQEGGDTWLGICLHFPNCSQSSSSPFPRFLGPPLSGPGNPSC